MLTAGLIAENESDRHQAGVQPGNTGVRPGDGRVVETAHRGERPSRDSAPKAGDYIEALHWRRDSATALAHRRRRVTY